MSENSLIVKKNTVTKSTSSKKDISKKSISNKDIPKKDIPKKNIPKKSTSNKDDPKKNISKNNIPKKSISNKIVIQKDGRNTKSKSLKIEKSEIASKEKNDENDKAEFECLPWIEKHRPTRMCNVKTDEEIQTEIVKMILKKDLPHIILEGPPGVGKTSSINCIAREIYKKYYSEMVLDMNASDDRGSSIQDSIENFRKAYVHIDEADKDTTPTFKMVILDEADNMTDKAKHIISSFIKNAVNDLRFAFTCNIKDNISTSIQSGCHIIKYPPLTDDIIKTRLREICVLEGIITESTTKTHIKQIEKGISALTQITNGDLRNAINKLQLTHNRYGDVSEDMVFTINDKPHPQKSKEIIVSCINQNLCEAIIRALEMRKKGYSGTDICLGLHLALRLDICDDIPEIVKIEMWKCIGYSSFNISKGLDSSVPQITGCITDMYICVKKLKQKKLL